jgi:hypothetical protein
LELKAANAKQIHINPKPKTKMKTTNRTSHMAPFWSCLVVILIMQLTASAQTLVNRYSFNTDVTGTNVVDSVGGPAWYGTIPNGGDFTTVPGQLILTSSSQQYVQLPAGILSNYTAVTIDLWATFGTLPGACFLYGFGNTDSGGAGENYIFCQPQNGRIAMSGVDTGWQGEQGCGGMGDLSGQTIHVTSVYNPVSGYIELYTNGVLVSANNAVTVPMSSISNQLNYIARSLYTGDSYMDVELNEFRIWNGALNGLQVAGSEIGGPDTVSLSPGTVTSIQLQVPYFQLVQGGTESATVSASASLFPSPIGITRLCTYASGNTGILTVNTNGVISAVGQGTTTIVATYSSLTSTQTITVVQPASVLTHRYSFTADASDSVGGAAWNGTVPNGGTFAGNQLQLAAASSQYVQFPAGIISNYAAVTIEAWASFPTALPGNCFFFGFGNTDGGGAGESYIYLQPSAGHIGITGSDPGWQGPENTAGTYGNLSLKTNVHLSAVFNPQAHWIAVYTNGILAGKNLAVTWQMNQVSSVLNYIARSLYTGDSYMDVNVDEYRIYNGALTGQGVAISDAAGPNSIPAGVTNGPGALLSLSIQAPATLQVLQTGQVKLLANYTSLTGWDIINNSVIPPTGLTVSTSNTNVLVYGADGLLHGVNAGTASVVTVYQGITNTASVTVVQAPQATLTHRYSFFNEPDGSLIATDSIAGFNGTLVGSANITGGLLVIPNTAQTAPAPDYLLLPNGILTNAVNGVGTNFNDPSVTIETWATFASSQGYWAGLFDFGYQDTGGSAAYDIHVGQLGGNTTFGIADSDDANGHNQTGTAGSVRGTSNLHVVAIFNPPAGYLACYTNGVLASVLNNVTISMAGVWAVVNKVGADLWPDPGMQGSVSEFRIYNGVLSPNDVLSTQVLGPNQVLASSVNLSVAASGGNLVVSWPVAGGSYSLQSKSSLTSGTWNTIASPLAQIVGSQWQVTVPNTGGAKFYRLVR